VHKEEGGAKDMSIAVQIAFAGTQQRHMHSTSS